MSRKDLLLDLATDDDVWRALYSGAIFGLAFGTMFAELTDA